MEMVDRTRFRELYLQGAAEIVSRMPTDLSELAKHNRGWRRGAFDHEAYLRNSEERYWRAYRILCLAKVHRFLDVGGLLGAFPLVMKRLDFDVALAERFDYYGGSIDAIADHLRDAGVEVISADFTETNPTVSRLVGTFEGVTCMAVAEHLAHSPRVLMENIRNVLRSNGTLIFEVPNVAYWPKRYAFFMRGETVHSPIDDVYHSAIPFTGHHREYTLKDARYVVRAAGFEIICEQTFNYGFDRSRLWNRIKYAPALLLKTWAELILLECRRPASLV